MRYQFGEFTAHVRVSRDERATAAMDLRRRGQRVSLTENPARLLLLFLRTAGTTLTHRDIEMGVWGQDPTDTRPRYDEDNVRVLVNHVRKALDDEGPAHRYIQTERGRGYVFREPVIVRRRGGPARAVAAVLLAGSVVAWIAMLRPPVESAPAGATPEATRRSAAQREASLTTPESTVPAPPVSDRRSRVPSTPTHRPRAPVAPDHTPPGEADPPAPSVARHVLEAPEEAAVSFTAGDAELGTTQPDSSMARAAPLPSDDACPALEALARRLDDHEALMNRMCAGGDVGGLLNARWTIFDLAGIPPRLRRQVEDLGAYEGHLARFSPVGREFEAAEAVRAECRQIRHGSSLWRVSWNAVHARLKELRSRAACVNREGT